MAFFKPFNLPEKSMENKKSLKVRVISAVILLIFIIAVMVFTLKNKHMGENFDVNSYTYTTFDYFDTIITITVYDIDKDSYDRIIKEVDETIKEYDEAFDIYTAGVGADIYNINKNAGVEPVKVKPYTVGLLLSAVEGYEKTNGATNVCIGALTSIWHKYREEGVSLPDKELLIEAAKHIDIENLEIDVANSTVFLKDKDASLDVGAIAKGFAAEEAAAILHDNGIENAILSFGGNIIALGDKMGVPFNVAIEDPIHEGENIAVLSVKDMAIVTSGDYQRYYEVNGKRYCHIIDSKTLYPATLHSSVTVVSKDSTMADVLSTALFTMSIEDGEELIRSFKDVYVMWVSKDGTITYSKGFKDHITVK